LHTCMRRRAAPANDASHTSPAVMAQRLCDLLLTFPSAASSGVQWHTLTRKYEERHSARLNIAALGSCSPLAAATALLWDVLRLVDGEDTDNPVVAVEDAVVLTPRPKSLGTWPSLYQTLQKIVLSHGSPEKHAEVNGCEVSRGLLLSQLKPLLQTHWHTNFEEGGLGYLSDEGTWVRVKKMKHLVQAVLRWRDQRVAWQAAVGGRPSAVDEAVVQRMDLVPSKRYNDLVLRCVQPVAATTVSLADCSMPPVVSPTLRPGAVEEERYFKELALLRAENAQLRMSNDLLLQQKACPGPTAASAHFAAPMVDQLFDNPFEPPPERTQLTDGYGWWVPFLGSPAASTAVPSEMGFVSDCPGTPISMGSHFFAASSSSGPSEHSGWPDSGPATPMGKAEEWQPLPMSTPISMSASLSAGLSGVWSRSPQAPVPVCTAAAPCALMPVWFPSHALSGLAASRFLGDRYVIPNGIVQQAREMFEPPVQMHPQEVPQSCLGHYLQ